MAGFKTEAGLRLLCRIPDIPVVCQKGRGIVDEVGFLRDQAQRCFALSRNCFDLGAAGKLRELGDQCTARADELELGKSFRPWLGIGQ